MAEYPPNGTPEQYEETHHPRNPPNSVTNKAARQAAVRSYFLPVVALFAVIGLALLFWSARGPQRDDVDPRLSGSAAVGTSGDAGAGGHEPQPGFDDTHDELQGRGGDLAPLTSIGGIHDANPASLNRRRVALDDVEVESAQGNTFWVRDGDEKIEVIAPTSAPTVQALGKVDVHGTLEADGRGTTRIRAEQVDVRR